MLRLAIWGFLLAGSLALMWQIGAAFDWWVNHPAVEGRNEAFEGIILVFVLGSPLLIGLYYVSQLKATKLSRFFRVLGVVIPVAAVLEIVVVLSLPTWIST